MRKKTKKKIFLSVISLILAAAMGVGIWYGVTHSQKDPVAVISFENVGMTEYWGDNMESHGPVSSDNIQTVFLSDTQTVTEVLVKEGDTVKKGDPMMTFDTTLSGLDLERKRLEVEKLKLELQDAEAELKRIMSMRPMQTPPPMPDPGSPSLGTELQKPYRISGKMGFDGSSPEAPLICWIRDDREVDERLVAEILKTALDLRTEGGFFPQSSPSAEDDIQQGKDAEALNTEPAATEQQPSETAPQVSETETQPADPSTEPESSGFPSRDGGKLGVVTAAHLDIRRDHDLNAEVLQTLGRGTSVYVFERWESDDKVPWAYVEVMGAQGWVLRDGLEIEGEKLPEPTQPEETQPDVTEPDTTEPDQKPEESRKVTVNFFVEPADAKVTLWGASAGSSVAQIGRNHFRVNASGTYYYSVQHDDYKPVMDKKLEVHEENVEIHVSLEPYESQSGLNSVYVIFKGTEGNMSLGARNLWQGMKLYQNGYFQFFDASAIPDYTMAADLGEDTDGPGFDFGSGMTAAQIADLRAEQEKKIEELKLNVKMADAEYKIKKRELEDGNIYAEFDGRVVSLLTEEESRSAKKPIIKVSGGGGFQITGSVGELDREVMKLGQKVTVNDWNSGETYEGKIIEIGEFPVRSRGYSGRGNPNSSYYPFTVFVDGEADLQTGSYVNIQYSAGESENGIYLENPFIREEKGRTYVYVLGKNDRLEKRFVTTGKSLWGSYTEITSGLTAEDYLAFPYGKNVKPGVKAKIGDMSDIYG